MFDAPVGWQVKDRLSEPEPGAGFIGPYSEARSFAVVLMIRRYEKAPAGSSLDAILRELHETANKEAVRELATRAVEIDGYPSRVVRLKRVWRLLLLMVETPEFPVVERHLIIERGAISTG
ncbi:MAG: hypothetical protein HY284_01020 [Nitrospirae bacterium]|nr:hypothetical protein [Nitrospirota bacterium]